MLFQALRCFFRDQDNGPQISAMLRLGIRFEWNEFALSRLFIRIPALALVFWQGRDKREGENRAGIAPPHPHWCGPTTKSEVVPRMISIVCM